MSRKCAVTILIMLYVLGMAMMPVMLWLLRRHMKFLLPVYAIGFPISLFLNYCSLVNPLIKWIVRKTAKARSDNGGSAE